MNTRALALALAATLALSTGCGSRPFVPTTPAGFVDLGDKYDDFEYRATTADGVVLAARAFPNEPKGPLEFWSRTLERRMRETGGYALVNKRDVNARGMQGVHFTFGHDEGKEPYMYEIALFVSNDKIFVLEAGGPKPEVAKQQAQIDAFVQTFQRK
jgi:hypothetical protein